MSFEWMTRDEGTAQYCGVFTPPAVDPGLPPINIKITVSILLASVSAAVSTVLNPAVLAVTAEKERSEPFRFHPFPSKDSEIQTGKTAMRCL